jgi:hypothetical protein
MILLFVLLESTFSGISNLFHIILIFHRGCDVAVGAFSRDVEQSNIKFPLPRVTSNNYGNVKVLKNDFVPNNIIDSSFNKTSCCLLGADGVLYGW